MTENEQKLFDNLMEHNSAYYGYELSKGEIKTVLQAFEELKKRRAIGTIEEFKALKEKSEPKELEEHNFQDEVHHYLCPSCRSIVSFNQNYCDECGQAL